MPEISRFYGVVIRMYFGDHNPPHFHAVYGGEEAVFSINTLGIIEGKLPPRITGMIVEWASMHQEELLADWGRAISNEPLEKIDPLP